MNLVEWSFKFIKWTIVPICAECMYFVLCSSGYTRLCYIRSHYVAGIKCLEFALETLEWNTALRRSVSLYVSTCFIFVSADVASGKQCNETLHCEWPKLDSLTPQTQGISEASSFIHKYNSFIYKYKEFHNTSSINFPNPSSSSCIVKLLFLIK